MASNLHRVDTVVRMFSGAQKAVKIKKALIDTPTTATETGTGIIIPENALVEDVWVKVLTTDASGTLDVGTSGDLSDDPDGYLAGISLTADASSALRFGSLASGAVTLGALLFETGASSALRIPDVYSGGEEVSVTWTKGTNDTKFEVFVKYIEL
jgi:hypothetical protein